MEARCKLGAVNLKKIGRLIGHQLLKTTMSLSCTVATFHQTTVQYLFHYNLTVYICS